MAQPQKTPVPPNTPGSGTNRNPASNVDLSSPDQAFLQLLTVELEQLYEQHRLVEHMAHSMLKISISLLGFPLLVSAALLTANQIQIDNHFSLLALTRPLAYIVLAVGLFNLLPLFIIVEHHYNEVICKHAINDMRRLYSLLAPLSSYEHIKQWQPVLCTDRSYYDSATWGAVLRRVLLG